jgi:hypothetical protein
MRVLIAVVLASVLAVDARGQPQTRPDAVTVVSLAAEGDGLVKSTYRLADETTLDLNGLGIAPAAREEFPKFWLGEVKYPQAALLREGDLIDPSAPPAPPTPEPSSALDSVSGDNPAPTSVSPLDAFLSWMQRHWEWVVAVLSLPPLGFVVRKSYTSFTRWRTSRNVEMVYCGLPAAGKTALIARLREPELPPEHFDTNETTRKTEEKHYGAIEKFGVNFLPVAFDIPGGKPALFLERLLLRDKVQTRRILLIVLAPFSGVAPQEGADFSFVKEQSGYLFGLVGAVLGSTKLPKPQLVVVFLNKRDLYLGDDASFEAHFKEDVDRIGVHCQQQGIKWFKARGSARLGQGTNGMMASIVERLGK